MSVGGNAGGWVGTEHNNWRHLEERSSLRWEEEQTIRHGEITETLGEQMLSADVVGSRL